MEHLTDSTSIAAYATVILAAITAWMANETRKLARQGHSSAQWTDYQHQEALTPILLLEPRTIKYSGQYYIENEIVNRGSGPAVEVSFTFTLPNGQSKTWEVPPLGIGDRYRVEGTIPWKSSGEFTPWQARIDYKNIFEAPAWTQYMDLNAKTYYSRPPRINRMESRDEPLAKRAREAVVKAIASFVQ